MTPHTTYRPTCPHTPTHTPPTHANACTHVHTDTHTHTNLEVVGGAYGMLFIRIMRRLDEVADFVLDDSKPAVVDTPTTCRIRRSSGVGVSVVRDILAALIDCTRASQRHGTQHTDEEWGEGRAQYSILTTTTTRGNQAITDNSKRNFMLPLKLALVDLSVATPAVLVGILF